MVERGSYQQLLQRLYQIVNLVFEHGVVITRCIEGIVGGIERFLLCSPCSLYIPASVIQ
jgi:hypothetical protein